MVPTSIFRGCVRFSLHPALRPASPLQGARIHVSKCLANFVPLPRCDIVGAGISLPEELPWSTHNTFQAPQAPQLYAHVDDTSLDSGMGWERFRLHPALQKARTQASKYSDQTHRLHISCDILGSCAFLPASRVLVQGARIQLSTAIVVFNQA